MDLDDCDAFTVILASPHASTELSSWQERMESDLTTAHMPLWDAAELEACRRLVRPTEEERVDDERRGVRLGGVVGRGQPAAMVALAFERFGGYARTALNYEAQDYSWDAQTTWQRKRAEDDVKTDMRKRSRESCQDSAEVKVTQEERVAVKRRRMRRG